MNPSLTRKLAPKGFTLVEVIVTIIAVSIVSVIFMNFMGKAVSKSTQAVEMVQGEASAEVLLECIVADYVFRMNQFSSPDPLAALAGDISGKRICGLDNIRTPGVTTAYIAFDASGNEIPPGPSTRTLKVTVAAPGNDLTTLLTLSRNANSPPVGF
jgi:prepilin-type N-terminal cleavage/methylation domain-containing protein